MIRQYSTHSLLWRCVAVLQLADYVSATKPQPQPLLTVPLRELLSWERNGKFKRLIGSRSPLPTLRLTIDSAGISKLERFPKPPMYVGESTSRFAFIVQDEASISHVMAQIKVRLCHLSCFGSHVCQQCFLLGRTDGYALIYPLGHPRSPFGTLPRRRACLFAKRIPRSLLRAGSSPRLRWTRYQALPFSSPSVSCLAFISTAQRNLAPWIRLRGISQIDFGGPLFGFICLYHGTIARLSLASEKHYHLET